MAQQHKSADAVIHFREERGGLKSVDEVDDIQA
jgi:hypothetical protein